MRLHRAAKSRLPLSACRADASLACAGKAEGDATGGDVLGGHFLQLLLGARKYAAGAREKRAARWEFENLRLTPKLLFEFRDRRRLLRFGQRGVAADHLDLVLDEGALSLGIAA